MKNNTLHHIEKNVREPFTHISLSYTCIQVILRSLLGDGSLKIQKNYKNARLQIRHSILQKEYLIWKATYLKEIGLARLQTQKADGFSQNAKISFQSRAAKELTQIHNIVCKNNTLHIEFRWLNAIDELALLVWWLDDGSLVSNGKRGRFCTHIFSTENHQVLQQYFLQSWQIHTTIGHVTRVYKNSGVALPPYNVLHLNTTDLRKLFHLIMPLLENESMVRKFAIRYKKRIDQERWISLMKKAMPKFHDEIDRLYGHKNDVSLS